MLLSVVLNIQKVKIIMMLKKKIKLKKRKAPLIVVDRILFINKKAYVYQGYTLKTKVAVKSIRIKKASLFYKLGFKLYCAFTKEFYWWLKVCTKTDIRDVFKELMIMNKLQNNENIMKLFDFRVTKYNFFIVMELCHLTLEDLLLRRSSKKEHFVPQEVLLHIIGPIVSAMAYMHSKKVVHYDIKPQNIFIDRSFVPKLGDFGGSRFFSDLKKPIYFGSKKYKAPELILREKVITPRIDSFSLGATCCLALYGDLFKISPFIFRLEILENKKKTVKEQNSFLQYRYNLGGDAPSPLIKESLKSFLKGLIIRNGKDRFSSTEMLNHPIIVESLDAWKLKEKSKTFKKKHILLKKKMKKSPRNIYINNRQFSTASKVDFLPKYICVSC